MTTFEQDANKCNMGFLCANLSHTINASPNQNKNSTTGILVKFYPKYISHMLILE